MHEEIHQYEWWFDRVPLVQFEVVGNVCWQYSALILLYLYRHTRNFVFPVIPASVPTLAVFENEPSMLIQPLLLLAFKLVLCPILTFPKIFFVHLVVTCPWMYLNHLMRVSACVTPNYCFYGSCNHVHHNSCILPCFCTHPISRMYYSSINVLVFKQNPLLHISVISEHSIGVHQLFTLCNINFLCLTDKIVWCLHTHTVCLHWQLFQFLL
jgi:hypothetical protein